MSALPRTWRPFVFSCFAFSIALIITAFLYSHQHPADPWLVTAALPAFWLEGILFLGATLEQPRLTFLAMPGLAAKAALLWVSTFAPYLIFSLLAGTFHRNAFLFLLGLTGVLCFWQATVPRRWIYDAGFLIVAAAPIVTRVFRRLYLSPDPHVSVDILGHLMWLRAGIVALLVLRRWNPGAFGLWPNWQEWKSGAVCYGLSILPVCLLAVSIHDVQFAPLQKPFIEIVGIGLGTFFGILWVVALGEELFFRGVIARVIRDWSGSPVAAILLSAILYGCSHLWYHAYPNWRRALTATLIGVFCGALYLRTGSVRASMVTHSLIVATWRVLFTA